MLVKIRSGPGINHGLYKNASSVNLMHFLGKVPIFICQWGLLYGMKRDVFFFCRLQKAPTLSFISNLNTCLLSCFNIFLVGSFWTPLDPKRPITSVCAPFALQCPKHTRLAHVVHVVPEFYMRINNDRSLLKKQENMPLYLKIPFCVPNLPRIYTCQKICVVEKDHSMLLLYAAQLL